MGCLALWLMELRGYKSDRLSIQWLIVYLVFDASLFLAILYSYLPGKNFNKSMFIVAIIAAMRLLLYLFESIIFYYYEVIENPNIYAVSFLMVIIQTHYILLVIEMVLMKNLFSNIKNNKFITNMFLITGFVLMLVNIWVLNYRHNLALHLIVFTS